MVQTRRQQPVLRRRSPELEYEQHRLRELGYEAPEDVGWIRCLAHGFPSPLARWHFHEEYELHLIVATTGRAFVGDWIGRFEPGHLVLCGPRLPHNWLSGDAPEGGVSQRDLVIQFLHEPIARAAEVIPEFAEALPLLERARNGIEFFGLSEAAGVHWHRVRKARGLDRLAAFCAFLGDLAHCTDYRLLSSAEVRGDHHAGGTNPIADAVEDIVARANDAITLSEFASRHGMSESRFSRLFQRSTGNSFTDFVNRVRVGQACQLLMESDLRVTDICYQVGFNNVSNFNRRFLEIKGMTPRDFRRGAARRFGGQG